MFHRCLERPDAGLYVHQRIWPAAGRIDLEQARQAWGCTAVHHEPLRAYFHLGQGREPRLFFADDLRLDAVRIGVLDSESDFEAFLAADRAQGFDFATPPLWRMVIFQDGLSDVVVWTYHHLLMDGPSRAIVFQDWLSALRAIAAGNSPQLSAVRRPSFSDHLAALQAIDTAASRTLWNEQLSGFSGGTLLPPWPLETRAADSEPVFGEVEIEDVQSLSARAKMHGVTLNAVVQGAWALVLGRYNAVEDVTFGTIRAGRHMHGHDRATAPGMFITTVPFRVDVTASQAVGPWLKHLAEQQVAIRAGEFASPTQIREWAEVSPELPLFRTVLVYSPEDTSEIERNGEIRDVTRAEGVSLAVYAGRNLRLVLEAPSDEYSNAQIRTVLADVRAIILALTQAVSDETLATIEVKTLGERVPVAIGAATTFIEFPREQSVVDFFRKSARQRTDAAAIRQGAREISFDELDRRSDQLAARLRGDFAVEEPVVLVLDKSIEFVIAALGVLKAGGSYLPLDPYAPPRNLRQRLAQSGARWTLTVADWRSKLKEWPGKLLEVDTELDIRGSGTDISTTLPAVESDPSRRAYLICTSGSTGAPKMVEIEHHSLTNLICHYQRQLALTTSDRISWLSPPAFDASVADLWPGLCSGATVKIPEKQYAADPDGLIAWIAEEGITVAFVSTPLAELLMRRRWPPRLALRFLLVGGDVLHVWPPAGLPFIVLNTYGPTESTVDAVWSLVRSGPTSSRPPIGRPISNVTCYVLDEQRRLLPKGAPGELYLGGEQIARGYLGEPQVTRQRFIPNPFSAGRDRLYRTGDIVRWNGEGELEFLGRTDLQVQIGGRRVELEEIESVLSRHSAVVEACCTPIKDGLITRSVVAHIATASASAELTDQLRDFLRAELPAYMIPAEFIFHARLPHTYAGKVDRAVLAAHTPRSLTPQTIPFAGSLDSQLRMLWYELFPREGDVDADKSFWALGGDSLKLIQLVLGFEEATGQHLSLPAFLRDPTFHGLRNILCGGPVNDIGALRGSSSKRLPALVQLQNGTGELALLFICPEPDVVRLAQMIGAEWSIFAVDAPWPMSWRVAATNDTTAELPTLAQLAAPLVAPLDVALLSRSLVLVGHSVMGLVAFELAHQLQKLGANVETLMLLDTWRRRPPRFYVEWAGQAYYWKDYGARLLDDVLNRWRQKSKDLQEQQSIGLVGASLQSALLVCLWTLVKATKTIRRFIKNRILASLDGRTLPEGKVTAIFDEKGTPVETWIAERLQSNAEKSYTPITLDCHGVLFRTNPDREELVRAYDETLGWKGLFAQGLDIVTIPGDHHSIIREESNRTMLANKIACLLEMRVDKLRERIAK
jgi:amino acid adenylation domain-containing protein